MESRLTGAGGIFSEICIKISFCVVAFCIVFLRSQSGQRHIERELKAVASREDARRVEDQPDAACACFALYIVVGNCLDNCPALRVYVFSSRTSVFPNDMANVAVICPNYFHIRLFTVEAHIGAQLVYKLGKIIGIGPFFHQCSQIKAVAGSSFKRSIRIGIPVSKIVNLFVEGRSVRNGFRRSYCIIDYKKHTICKFWAGFRMISNCPVLLRLQLLHPIGVFDSGCLIELIPLEGLNPIIGLIQSECIRFNVVNDDSHEFLNCFATACRCLRPKAVRISTPIRTISRRIGCYSCPV